MTTHVTIADNQIDQDSPVTVDLMTALRDNPKAKAEGASGAVILSTGWHPYDAVTVGDGNDGEIYSFAVDGALATVVTPNFADGYEYAIMLEDMAVLADATVIFEIYLSITAAYSTIDSTAWLAVRNYAGMAAFKLPRFSRYIFNMNWELDLIDSVGSPTLGTGQKLAGNSTKQVVNKARIGAGVSTFSAGKIYLYRRREFITG